MKSLLFFILTVAISAILSFSVNAQSDKQFSKMQEKQYKDKCKELKKAGWVTSGETFTLDFALARFYRAFFADPNNQNWVGHVANCRVTIQPQRK